MHSHAHPYRVCITILLISTMLICVISAVLSYNKDGGCPAPTLHTHRGFDDGDEVTMVPSNCTRRICICVHLYHHWLRAVRLLHRKCA